MAFQPFPAHRVALVATVALLVGALELYANPGALRVSEAAMGEYRVSVWTDPTPVRPGSMTVNVLVVRPGLEGVAEGVDVHVRLGPADAAADVREHLASREEAMDPRYYAATFELEEEGAWDVEVRVDGEHGRGSASFQVTARERGWLAHPVTIAILALIPLAALTRWAFRRPGDARLD